MTTEPWRYVVRFDASGFWYVLDAQNSASGPVSGFRFADEESARDFQRALQ